MSRPRHPHRPARRTHKVVRIEPMQILDGPWVITTGGGATMYAWTTDAEVGGDPATQAERYARSGSGSLPWLKNGVGWTIARTTAAAVAGVDLFRYRDLTVYTGGDVPPPTNAGPVLLATQPTVGTREVAGFHDCADRWYRVEDTGTEGPAGVAYMHLVDNGDGTVTETLRWAPGFTRPSSGHTWYLTWLATPPTQAQLDARPKSMTATITL